MLQQLHYPDGYTSWRLTHQEVQYSSTDDDREERREYSSNEALDYNIP